jgi:hypothetical protein
VRSNYLHITRRGISFQLGGRKKMVFGPIQTPEES